MARERNYDDMSLLGLLRTVGVYVKLPASTASRIEPVLNQVSESGWRGTALSSDTRMIIADILTSAVDALPLQLAARAREFIAAMKPADNAVPGEYRCFPGYSHDNVYNTSEFIAAFIKLTPIQVELIHTALLPKTAFSCSNNTRSSLKPCGVKPEELMKIAVTIQAVVLVDCLKRCIIPLFFHLFTLYYRVDFFFT